MSYRKRYEDSYLDDEDDEEFDEKTDEQKLELLLQKNPRNQKDTDRLKRVAERLLDKATAAGNKEHYYKMLDILADL